MKLFFTFDRYFSRWLTLGLAVFVFVTLAASASAQLPVIRFVRDPDPAPEF